MAKRPPKRSVLAELEPPVSVYPGGETWIDAVYDEGLVVADRAKRLDAIRKAHSTARPRSGLLTWSEALAKASTEDPVGSLREALWAGKVQAFVWDVGDSGKEYPLASHFWGSASYGEVLKKDGWGVFDVNACPDLGDNEIVLGEIVVIAPPPGQPRLTNAAKVSRKAGGRPRGAGAIDDSAALRRMADLINAGAARGEKVTVAKAAQAEPDTAPKDWARLQRKFRDQ